MADYVLVHGAWHGGWVWRRVARALRAAGHEVHVPTLTGLGERAHLLAPDVGLDTHIRDVLGMLEYEDLSDVVLVGHSYAGMVIAGVADRAPDRVARLVYLDAFVPADGQALVDFQPPEVRAMFAEQVREHGDGYKLPSFPAEVFGITDEADLAWVRPRLGPHPYRTKTDAVRLTDPRGARCPRTFVYCNAPAIGPFGQFAERLRNDPAWEYLELATGHDAMVTAPVAVTRLLLAMAPVPAPVPVA